MSQDEQMESTFRQICASLELSKSATDLVLGLWASCQFFDDVLDLDSEKAGSALDGVMRFLLIESHLSAFYQQNAIAISSCIAVQLAKWKAANYAEENGFADVKSYMWRAGFYDLLLLIVMLDKGIDYANASARDILQCYGEQFQEYLTEFHGGQNA